LRANKLGSAQSDQGSEAGAEPKLISGLKGRVHRRSCKDGVGKFLFQCDELSVIPGYLSTVCDTQDLPVFDDNSPNFRMRLSIRFSDASPRSA
jgi:hypothetical protein